MCPPDIWRLSLTLSSSGLGHRPFTAVTRVRIPLGSRFQFIGDFRSVADSRLWRERVKRSFGDVPSLRSLVRVNVMRAGRLQNAFKAHSEPGSPPHYA